MSSHTINQLHQFPVPILKALLSPRFESSSSSQHPPIRDIVDDIDWKSIACEADSHAIGVLVYTRMADLNLLGKLPADIAARWKADSRHARLQHLIQLRDVLTYSKGLTDAGIRHAFFKGFAYREWLYAPAWVRLGGDADILIDRRDIEEARRIANQHGYTQAAYTPDHKHFRPATPQEIAEVEASHYELAEFTKDHVLVNVPEWLLEPNFIPRSPFAFGTEIERPVLHSSIDIHWAIHFIFENAHPLEELHAISIPFGRDEQIPVLSIEWNIIISGFKLYFEAFDRPGYGYNHLVDLAALFRHNPAETQWDTIDTRVRKYGLEAAMFYTLSAAQRLAGNTVIPPETLEGWSRTGASDTLGVRQDRLDFGDFVPFLFKKRVPTSFMMNDKGASPYDHATNR